MTAPAVASIHGGKEAIHNFLLDGGAKIERRAMNFIDRWAGIPVRFDPMMPGQVEFRAADGSVLRHFVQHGASWFEFNVRHPAPTDG